MTEPVTPLPSSKADGQDEPAVLLGYLRYHRIVLARKVEGVSDADAARAVFPSSRLTLLGLIRHMTDVERWWFRMVVQGEEIDGRFEGDEEWDVPGDATVSAALADYWEEIATVDAFLDTADMDRFNTAYIDVVGEHRLRRTIVHMIEEYARHNGHADLLRESIDGRVGHDPPR